MAPQDVEKKTTLIVPFHHKWTKGVRGLSLVIEYLLDQHFGTEYSEDPEENARITAATIIKAQKIIDLMRKRRREDKQEAKEILLSRKLKRSKIIEPDD